MSSLAAGIAERGELRGIRIGEKRGEKRGIRIGFQQGEVHSENRMMAALRMLKKNLPLETIMEKTGLTLERLTEMKAMF